MRTNNTDLDCIARTLDSGAKEAKIRCLEGLAGCASPEIAKLVISRLDDDEIEVRGEAFSSLVMGGAEIAAELVRGLGSEKKNVRAFLVLILANRRDTSCIQEIVGMTRDESSTVRSCALGALGFLRASEAQEDIRKCLLDPSLEVRKSALQAALDLGVRLSSDELDGLSLDQDDELEKLLTLAGQS